MKQLQKKWTVFFIIKAAGSSSVSEVIRMINEIRCIELYGLPVIICLNFFKENLDAIMKGDETKISTIERSTDPTTIFLSVIPDKRSVKRNGFVNKLSVIDENPEFDLTNPDSIENYFRNEILLPYMAKHYLLISWDHGRLFGIFDSKANSNDGKAREFSETELRHEKDTKILTMEELNDAIRMAFGKKKVDVMLMMNCYMQFINAGYALRHSVKYLVAPESTIYIDGYNYAFLFHILINKPGISPRKLAKQIVTSFASKVHNSHADTVSHKSDIAIFANDLRYYSLVGRLVDRLVEHFIKNIEQIKPLIETAKRFSSIRHSKDIVDFFGFISFLEKSDYFKGDALAANLTMSVRTLVVIKGQNSSTRTRDSDTLVNPPSGLSIHLPTVMPTNEPNPGFDDFFKTEFSIRTKWVLFITELSKS